MTALDETTPAPRSFAVYTCQWCDTETNEPFDLDEPALRAALDDGAIPAMRLHRGCRVVAIEQVTRTGKTIFAVLGELAP